MRPMKINHQMKDASKPTRRTLMGIPVTWKPWGNSTRLPNILWYPAANSILEMVKAWPRCREPFMYG